MAQNILGSIFFSETLPFSTLFVALPLCSKRYRVTYSMTMCFKAKKKMVVVEGRGYIGLQDSVASWQISPSDGPGRAAGTQASCASPGLSGGGK